MYNSHMFDYSQLHRSAFLERKCNFRLALIYFKTFLPLPPPDSAAHIQVLAVLSSLAMFEDFFE